MGNIGINEKLVKKIQIRNSPGYVFAKFCIGFFFILALAAFLGALFCRISVTSVSDDIKQQVAKHFLNVFYGCDKMSDYFSVIIFASSADIRYLILIFTSGFTFFCKYATGAVIAVRAFSLGFCTEFLLETIKENSIALPHPKLCVLIFFISRMITLLLTVYLSAKATVFGDDFRRLRGIRNLILHSPIIYRYIFLFLTALGLFISVNAVYCFVFSII